MEQELAEILSDVADKRSHVEEKLMYWRHQQYWAEKAGDLEAKNVAFLDDLDKESPEYILSWREQTELEITEMICEAYHGIYNSLEPRSHSGTM